MQAAARCQRSEQPSGPLGATLEAFFVSALVVTLGEIGDKTQLASVALAARFDSLVAVVCGTTVGMLIADVPAVLLGGKASLKLPLKAIRYVAAALFAAIGIAALAG